MITGFEELTEPLTEKEETVFLPPILQISKPLQRIAGSNRADVLTA